MARPYKYFGEVEFYPTCFEKSAAIIESIFKNYLFIDENKRTGFLTGYTSLYRYEYIIIADQEHAYQFIITVALSNISFNEIVLWLYQHIQSL